MKSPSKTTRNNIDVKRGYIVQSVVRAAAILNSFQSTSEVMDLRVVAARVGLHKATTFRLLETLVETHLLERAGKQGYRCCVQPSRTKRYRIGYGSQTSLLPFTATVSDGLVVAANAANIDLLVLNNGLSPRIALQNADTFVSEKVDLVIDSQINIGSQRRSPSCSAKTHPLHRPRYSSSRSYLFRRGQLQGRPHGRPPSRAMGYEKRPGRAAQSRSSSSASTLPALCSTPGSPEYRRHQRGQRIQPSHSHASLRHQGRTVRSHSRYRATPHPA